MVNSNANAMGIIFPNSYDSLVPELVNERLMASIPFGGRYRLVDFILSSMVNSGIDNINVLVRNNYHSLMDHLGSGREWDLARKNGGLNIFPPYAEKNMKPYSGRVEAIYSILPTLEESKEKYVVLTDANVAVNFDFKALMNAHIESGADVTVAYAKEEIPTGLKRIEGTGNFYYTLKVDNGRVTKFYINSKDEGIQNLSMNIFILERTLLIDLINTGFVRGSVYFERDVLATKTDKLNIQAFEFDGYHARICDMKSYFEENMKLLDDANLDALFSGNPIYTKIRDDNPTRYIPGAKVKNVLVSDGCVIEGEVENSVLFRGVKIGKGAKVKNCVLMQDTVIKDGSQVEYVITDKDVTITENKELCGTDSFQVFVAKGQVV